jgi:hypothetical protein
MSRKSSRFAVDMESVVNLSGPSFRQPIQFPQPKRTMNLVGIDLHKPELLVE